MAALTGLSATPSHPYHPGFTGPNPEGRPMVKDAAPRTRIVPPPPAVTRMAVPRSTRFAVPDTRALLPPFVPRRRAPAPRPRGPREPAAWEHGAPGTGVSVLSADALAATLEALAAAIRQDGFAAIDRLAVRDDLARAIAKAVAGYRAGRGEAG